MAMYFHNLNDLHMYTINISLTSWFSLISNILVAYNLSVLLLSGLVLFYIARLALFLLSVCLSVCLSVYLSIYISIYVYVHIWHQIKLLASYIENSKTSYVGNHVIAEMDNMETSYKERFSIATYYSNDS